MIFWCLIAGSIMRKFWLRCSKASQTPFPNMGQIQFSAEKIRLNFCGAGFPRSISSGWGYMGQTVLILMVSIGCKLAASFAGCCQHFRDEIAGSPAIPQHVPTTCSADHIPNLQAEKRGRSGQLLRFQLLHQQLLQVYWTVALDSQ